MTQESTTEAVTALLNAWEGRDPNWDDIPACLLTVLAWIIEGCEPGEA
jgi:hypothetical protein